MNKNDFYFMTSFATFSIGVTYFRLRVYMDRWLISVMDNYPIVGVCFCLLLFIMVYNLVKIMKQHKQDSDSKGSENTIKRNDFYFMMSFVTFTLNTLLSVLDSGLFGFDGSDHAISRMWNEYPIISLLYIINIVIMIYHLVKIIKLALNKASKNV